MGNIRDYLEWRGDLTFAQDAFNAADNLLLSYIIYADLGGLGVDFGEGELSLCELCKCFFDKHSEEELSADRTFVRFAPYVMQDMAMSNRFKNSIVRNYINEVDSSKEIQFSAVEIELEDGTVNFCFRGTDDNIVAWKEDFNISLGEVPAQAAAVRYLNEAAKSDAPIRLTGHSKGANLAIYAAAACDRSVRDRIVQVYCNDGPGFLHDFVESEGYRHIQPRIRRYIPDSSVIGLLFENPAEPTIVKSNARGMLQHDILSWQISGRDVVKTELSESAIRLHETLHGWIEKIDDRTREQFVNDIFSILESTGVETITQVQDGGLKNAAAMLRELHQIVPGTWAELENLLKAVLPFWGFLVRGNNENARTGIKIIKGEWIKRSGKEEKT